MNVIYPAGIDGEVSRGEAEIIARVVSKCCGDGIAVEIGTLGGSTTNNIAANCSGQIVTVDLPKGAKPKLFKTWADEKYLDAEKRFMPEFAGRIRQVFCDSADLEFTGPIAFAFIDGCHSEEYCINDFKKVEPHMNYGGEVLFHDYLSGCWPGVTTGIQKLMAEYPQHTWQHFIGSSVARCTIYRD